MSLSEAGWIMQPHFSMHTMITPYDRGIHFSISMVQKICSNRLSHVRHEVISGQAHIWLLWLSNSMALTFAFTYEDAIYLAMERYHKYGSACWDGYIRVEDFYICIGDPLYHLVIRENRENIVIKNVSTPKMVHLLYENLLDIILRSGLSTDDSWERKKLTMLVCSHSCIWDCTESGCIDKRDRAVLSEHNWNAEKVITYLKTTINSPILVSQKPKTIIKNIFARYSESGWKIKMIKM